MKKFLLHCLILSVMFFAKNSFSKELSPFSVIDDSYSEGQNERYRITGIDSESYWTVRPKDIQPGAHNIRLLICIGRGGNCSSKELYCNIEAGYIYRVASNGCSQFNRRTDFEGATEYWNNVDITHAEKIKKDIGEKEAVQYQADKLALANENSKVAVGLVIASVERRVKYGLNHDDPDNLLGQARQKLISYISAEAEENSRKKNERNLAKTERKIAEAKEQQNVIAFRKSIEEGVETSCGLVIERKTKLIKLQLSSNTEKWVKIDDVFPVGYQCSFDGSTHVASSIPLNNGIQVGQTVCKNVQITKSWAYKNYNEDVKITGFVENSSASKVQIRISGMISGGSDITRKGTNINRIDGDIVLETGAVIWDESYKWKSCY